LSSSLGITVSGIIWGLPRDARIIHLLIINQRVGGVRLIVIFPVPVPALVPALVPVLVPVPGTGGAILSSGTGGAASSSGTGSTGWSLLRGAFLTCAGVLSGLLGFFLGSSAAWSLLFGFRFRFVRLVSGSTGGAGSWTTSASFPLSLAEARVPCLGGARVACFFTAGVDEPAAGPGPDSSPSPPVFLGSLAGVTFLGGSGLGSGLAATFRLSDA
jgi:hypothetical protein